MLPLSRPAVPPAAVAALAAPAVAQARPIEGGPHWDDQVPASIDKRAPDRIDRIPDPQVKYVPTSTTAALAADRGFGWGRPAIRRPSRPPPSRGPGPPPA